MERPWLVITGYNWLCPWYSGWLTYPSEKYEFVSWDDDIRN